MSKEIEIASALRDVLEQYKKKLETSLERALDECTEQYVNELERTAPRQADDSGAGKPYHKSFRVEVGKTRLFRFVGNDKMVSGKKRDEIPLINLLEYGRGPERVGARPHMNEALSRTADKMVKIIADKLEEVK